MKNMFGRAHEEAQHARRYGMSEAQLKQLATYNAEVARGIMHTQAWQSRMTSLQVYFNEAQNKHLAAEMRSV